MGHRSVSGFTLVELIVTLILIGIISAYVAPKLSGSGGYSELTARQNIKQAIRYAQQLAMSQTDKSVRLVTAANGVDVRIYTGANYVSANNYPYNPANVTITPAVTLTFDSLGSAGIAATQLNIVGAQTLRVCVAGTTGYARDC